MRGPDVDSPCPEEGLACEGRGARSSGAGWPPAGRTEKDCESEKKKTPAHGHSSLLPDTHASPTLFRPRTHDLHTLPLHLRHHPFLLSLCTRRARFHPAGLTQPRARSSPPPPSFFPPSRPCVSRRPRPPPWPPPCPRRTSCWLGSRCDKGERRESAGLERPSLGAPRVKKKHDRRSGAHCSRSPPPQAAIASKDYTTAKKTLVQLKVRVCVPGRKQERARGRGAGRARQVSTRPSLSPPLRADARRWTPPLNLLPSPPPTPRTHTHTHKDQDDRAALPAPALPGLADGDPGAGPGP